jgi:hypothetical protein
MRCPHCGLAINLEERKNLTAVYSYEEPEKAGLGYGLIHGHCPSCGNLIVILREGKYEMREYGAELFDITKEEIIFPKIILPKTLEFEIPQNYRDDYTEAYAVLPISPKASAAISRRLLQHILREEYKIKKGSLDKEIEEFIHLGNIPSHIGEAVDAVRNVGNFAAHPLKDTSTGEVVDVESGEAEWLLDVIDALFDFTFVQPRKLQERKSRLNAKLLAMGKPPIKS